VRNSPVILVSVTPEGSPKVRVDVSDRVLSMEYQDVEKAADKLILSIDNADLTNFDDPIWRKGNLITISWGYPEAMAIPRVCQIRKVMGFKELQIEALGKEVELNVETRSRVFENTRRSEVVRYIAEQWGFREEALLHIQDTEVERGHIVQARQTDAQFLRRLASKEGFEWYVDHDGFHFHEKNFFQRAAKVLTYNDDPDLTDILDISIETDVTRRAGSVKLKTHNPTKRRTIDVDANILTEEQKRAVLGNIVEAPGQTEKDVPGFKSIAHHVVGSTTETDEAAAKRHAAADFRGAQQRAVKCNITVTGDPNIHAKSVIELRGVGKRLSQLYYVRGTSHKVSGSYTTSLECISDGSGGHSTKSALAPEASAVQVGPAVKGKKATKPTTRRSIDVTPAPASPDVAAAGAPKPLTPVSNSNGSKAFVPPSTAPKTPAGPPATPAVASAAAPEQGGIHGAPAPEAPEPGGIHGAIPS
jgi:phage protein D